MMKLPENISRIPKIVWVQLFLLALGIVMVAFEVALNVIEALMKETLNYKITNTNRLFQIQNQRGYLL